MTWEPFAALATAFGLGTAHAFEVDHMTAVTAFVARRPTPKAAALFGVQWAVGHGVSLLLLGMALWALHRTLPESVSASLERLVGVALLGLGLWTLTGLRRERRHSHAHPAHEHCHPIPHTHGSHGHGSLWMGLLHGVAGTAAFVGETLVAMSSHSLLLVLLFTLLFSLGVLVSMAAYAGALGGVLTWGGRRFAGIARAAQILTGLFTCAVGILWIVR